MKGRIGFKPGVVICMVVLWACPPCLAGQNNIAVDSPQTSAAGQSVSSDTSAGHLKATGNAEAVDHIFQFKPVLEGETVTHVFKIRNTGMGELKILKVRTG